MATNDSTPINVQPLPACVKCDGPRGRGRKYCAACAIIVKNEINKELERLKRRAAGAVVIGSTMICQTCGIQCAVTNGAQKYCDDCSRAALLLVRRKAGKRHYYSHPPRVRESEEARERSRRYSAKHRKKERERSAAYNAANRALINAKSRAFRRTEKRRIWIREWSAKRGLHPTVRLNARMRTSVRRGLKEGKGGRTWQSLVGFTLADLVSHIERQFLPGMTWKNINRWNVDHIVPLAAFTFERASDPEFRAAWSLTNLRPLWDVENYSKGARREFLI